MPALDPSPKRPQTLGSGRHRRCRGGSSVRITLLRPAPPGPTKPMPRPAAPGLCPRRRVGGPDSAFRLRAADVDGRPAPSRTRAARSAVRRTAERPLANAINLLFTCRAGDWTSPGWGRAEDERFGQPQFPCCISRLCGLERSPPVSAGGRWRPCRLLSAGRRPDYRGGPPHTPALISRPARCGSWLETTQRRQVRRRGT